MKALILGDRFMTNAVMDECFAEATRDLGINFEIIHHSDEWPVAPMEADGEVSEYCGNDDEIVPLIADCDVLLTHTGHITRKVIEAAKSLKVIGVGRGGPTNINIQAATDAGIPVCFAPGRNSGAVAEYAVGLVLALTRNIATCHKSFTDTGAWRGDMYAFEVIGNEISESTVGLVGTGAIGNKVANLLAGFGANIIAYDPYLPDDRKAQSVAEFVELDELFRRADIISLHARYTKESAGLVSAERIALMKPTACLINTSRGELIDHPALYEALREKRIGGAALDVFEAEPPPADSPIFTLGNVIATTHLGGASRQAAYIGARVACEGIVEFLSGGKPRFVTNPESLLKGSIQ